MLLAMLLALAWNLPVTGGGPALNLCGLGSLGTQGSENSCDRSLTNASAHMAWATAVPFAGFAAGGKRGALLAGMTWIAFTVVQEGFFHAPEQPGSGYPAEVRTDLVTRIAPTLLVLAGIHLFGRSDPPR